MICVDLSKNRFLRYGEDVVMVSYGLNLKIDIKLMRYGENYREIIQKKWDMRKLNRKISKNLEVKNTTEKRIKI